MGHETRLAAVVAALTLLLGLLFAVSSAAEHAIRTGDPTWLPLVGENDPAAAYLYYNGVALVGFLLSPVLAFVAGYLFGRRIDLGRRIGRVTGSLALGAVLGYGVGRLAAVVWWLGTTRDAVDPLAVAGLVVPALVTVVAHVTVAGFAGVALAYLLARGRTTPESPEPTPSD